MNIDEELCDAKKYTEMYMEHKMEHPSVAQTYREMSMDELKHARWLFDMQVQEIENALN